jgi:hypothetical protein
MSTPSWLRPQRGPNSEVTVPSTGEDRVDEPQLVELTTLIALENFRSKFNPALGVEAQGFCLLPKRA